MAEAAPLTGPRFKMALATPAMRSWAECPLRQVIDQLGVYHRVAIFLDRRVDPGQKTSMNALMMPLGQTLDQLADTVNTKAVRFGSVIYIGPETTGHMLSILSDARREEARKMPDRGRAMLTPKSMKWDDLATPRELLKSLSEETGIPIGPVEAIPHDLWAGAELPSSSPVDRLTLILSQFDKTFSIAADAAGKPRILIVDIPEQVKKQAAAKVPSNETGTAGKTPSNSGTARHGSANNSGNFSRIRIKRFAVKQKQVETVLNYLASQWGLTLEVDRRKLKTKLKRRINVTKEEVTVGELLRAVLEPVGLQGEIDEQKRVLRVRVKQ
ncbi:MAG: hypothetical protein PVH19_13810 [Planctomycetia bacterium]